MIENNGTLNCIGCNCENESRDTYEGKRARGKVAIGSHSPGVSKWKKAADFGKENWALGCSFSLFCFGIFSDLDPVARLFVFALAYLPIAREVLVKAVKGVFKGRMLDENFLMGIASAVAFAIGEYPEAVAVMMFYQAGQIAEHYALERSEMSISALMDIKPEFANIKMPSGLKRVNPEDVKIGDTIVVKVGEKIPLDGIAISGSSSLNTSAITGESLPIGVEKDSPVFSGSINLSAVIEVRVEKDYSDSMVSKIIQLMEKAGRNRAKTEKFITRFAKAYTPAVVSAAILFALFPPIFMAEPFAKWIYRAAIFLVISCPCALASYCRLGMRSQMQ